MNALDFSVILLKRLRGECWGDGCSKLLLLMLAQRGYTFLALQRELGAYPSAISRGLKTLRLQGWARQDGRLYVITAAGRAKVKSLLFVNEDEN